MYVKSVFLGCVMYMHLLISLHFFPEVLQQKAIEAGALDVVEQYLQHYQLEDGLCNMVLVTIGSLTDSGNNTYLFMLTSVHHTFACFMMWELNIHFLSMSPMSPTKNSF